MRPWVRSFRDSSLPQYVELVRETYICYLVSGHAPRPERLRPVSCGGASLSRKERTLFEQSSLIGAKKFAKQSDALGQSASPRLAKYYAQGLTETFNALHFKLVASGHYRAW